MRILIVLLLASLLAACAAPGPAVPTTDEQQRREAELLVRYSLTERIVTGTRRYYRDQVGPLLAAKDIPAEQAGRLVAAELEAVTETEHPRLVDALVPIYRRYYTPEEIHQLLSFYQTEVARKSMRVSSQIAAEAKEFVRAWNEHFGAELVQGLEDELGEDILRSVD